MIIDPLFSSIGLSNTGLDKASGISEAFTRLLLTLGDTLPGNSREISIIKTKLEEASFYAKKALRNYKENLA